MFDTHSDYALNKADKNAIVCPSVTGEHIRLTREDFSSEEEFLYWKDWSDNDLHKIENDGQYDSVIHRFPLRRMCCLNISRKLRKSMKELRLSARLSRY